VGFTVRFRIDVLQHVCQVLSAQVIYLVAVSVILAVSASCLDCFRPPACFGPPGCFAQIKLFRIQGWLLRPAAAACLAGCFQPCLSSFAFPDWFVWGVISLAWTQAFSL